MHITCVHLQYCNAHRFYIHVQVFAVSEGELLLANITNLYSRFVNHKNKSLEYKKKYRASTTLQLSLVNTNVIISKNISKK